MLLTETDDLAAVIDWEFAYAVPTQVALDPPWWRLLDLPEIWYGGIDDWIRIYEARVSTWFAAIERAEKSTPVGQSGALPVPLSKYMRETWETGRFWLSYGARKSWAFDMAFWKFLDERFFGKRDGDVLKQDLWKTRLHLLTDEERDAMEPFVERKIKEAEELITVDWDPEEGRKRLAEVLLD